LFDLTQKAMKKNEKNSDKPKQENPDNQLQGGKGAPKLGDVNKASVKDGDQAPGVKPRASGRQGSIDVQDGGQDTGSSAGSH
jgi:hypothetical protein